MSCHELVQMFFERSNALQWYWNLYVIVIGGLLAYSAFRQQQNLLRTALVTVLFCLFAYKNLDAIHDVTVQRFAVLRLINESTPAGPGAVDLHRVREALEPTLSAATLEFSSIRNFHILCDLLTVAALWVMEWRRKKAD